MGERRSCPKSFARPHTDTRAEPDANTLPGGVARSLREVVPDGSDGLRGVRSAMPEGLLRHAHADSHTCADATAGAHAGAPAGAHAGARAGAHSTASTSYASANASAYAIATWIVGSHLVW